MPHNDGRAPADRGRPALARCVAVAADVFAAQYWGRAPLLSRAEDLHGAVTDDPRTDAAAAQSGFADLLTLDDVDDLLSRRGLRTPFLRLAKDGNVVGPARFTRSGGAGAMITDQVADDRVLDLVVDGSTVVLQGLHRTWPPVVQLATELAVDLGHPCQVNAYITPPQSQGFSAHYDVHDVFVLQVAGEKRWRIHAPVLPLPLRDQPWTDRRAEVAAAAAGEPVIDTVLRAGDALYLPRGFLHSAVALGGVSAHLTVGLHAVTRHTVAEVLLSLVGDDEQLRQSLPLGLDLTDPGRLAGDVAATVEALTERLARIDPQQVAAQLRRTVWPQMRPEPIGPLAVAAALRDLGKGSLVRLRLGVRWTITDDGAGLDLGDRTVPLPADDAAAVRVLLAGPPVALGDLPGLPVDEQVSLARQLLRAGVLVPADAEA